MCLPPPDVGPNYIPSIKEASLLRKVGIGVVGLSGSGTLKCEGAISPVGGPVLKSAKKNLLQIPFLELYHVYIYYMTSHVQFG
jgi:hypothetical protein